VKCFAPGVAVRPLGDADHHHILDTDLFQRIPRGAHLPLAAVDQHKVGPFALFAVRIFLLGAGEAPLEHFAHHREIVSGCDVRILDVELTIGILAETLRPRDDHAPDHVGALDMAVVVNLDPVRHRVQFEQVDHFPHDPGLGRSFCQPPVERFFRIAAGLCQQLAAIAALRLRYAHPVKSLGAERLGQQFRIGQIAIEQHQLRRRHPLVKLHQEAGEDLLDLDAGSVRGEEAAMAPVLPAANEEGLDADGRALGRQREYVGVGQARGVDRLVALDEGQRLQPVAVDRRHLEIERIGGLFHRLAELLLHLGRLARQEIARIIDQFGIILLADPVDAGRRAAPDLIEQTGPRAIVEETVGAGAQQEQLLQRVDRPVDRSGAGKRPEILALYALRPAVLGNAGKIMALAQQDEGKALVVAQQHIIGRAEFLDQLRLEQQGFRFTTGRHNRHRTGLRHHPHQPVRQPVHLHIGPDPAF